MKQEVSVYIAHVRKAGYLGQFQTTQALDDRLEIYLYICGLSDDAVSSSDCTESTDLINDKFEF
jgi:hypothetical protein